MRLKNKVAVITGGNSGIGLGIAREFKAEGASVAILGRDPKTLSKAAKELGEETLVVQGDISKMDDLEKLFSQTKERLGEIDILVANAAVLTVQPFGQVDESSFDNTVNINFKGTFFTIQKALPYMKDGASIILISSIAQGKGFAGFSVYSATKAAIRSLARTISAELIGDRGIRVNVISPGPIETPAFGRMGLPEDQIAGMKEGFKELVPAKRIGTTGEVAKIAALLASPDSSFIVGEEITVDGGLSNL